MQSGSISPALMSSNRIDFCLTEVSLMIPILDIIDKKYDVKFKDNGEDNKSIKDILKEEFEIKLSSYTNEEIKQNMSKIAGKIGKV